MISSVRERLSEDLRAVGVSCHTNETVGSGGYGVTLTRQRAFMERFMIRWQDLDPLTVERAIKLLIRRLHPTAQGIDGAGGDGGRDIRWDSAEGLVIFEAKSYPTRLLKSAKRKIEGSLTEAAAHGPVRWVLVIPLDPTPAEESWFDDLRAKFPGIALEWRGRDWLDGHFAEHADLRRYVEGSDYDLLQRARELDHERAALANGATDLVARVNAWSMAGPASCPRSGASTLRRTAMGRPCATPHVYRARPPSIRWCSHRVSPSLRGIRKRR